MKRLDTTVEKKYKSKTTLIQKFFFAVLAGFTVLLLVATLTGGISGIHPVIWILLILVDLYFLYPLVFRYEYYFTKDLLIIQEGPLFHTEIPYGKVTSYGRRGYFLNKKAKGSNTILLKYEINKRGHNMVEITPANMADFMSDLKKRVHLK